MLPLANDTSKIVPHFRFRGMSYTAVPPPVVEPVPEAWVGETLTMQIKAFNLTHYSFAAGPASSQSMMQTIAYSPAAPVSYGFTGTLLGVYCTTNGRNGTTDGSTEAYFSDWTYEGQGQIIN